MRRSLWIAAVALGLTVAATGRLQAQDSYGALSEAEVESLREVAPLPIERIKVFEKILDSRQKRVEELLASPRRAGFAQEMHDALEQFGQIADEFNDNLDEFSRQHRDVRKELPRLLKDTERWATVLRSPPADGGYDIVKKLALDTLGDTKEIATTMMAEQEAYFKEHPEAVKAEKDRLEKR